MLYLYTHNAYWTKSVRERNPDEPLCLFIKTQLFSDLSILEPFVHSRDLKLCYVSSVWVFLFWKFHMLIVENSIACFITIDEGHKQILFISKHLRDTLFSANNASRLPRSFVNPNWVSLISCLSFLYILAVQFSK